MCMCTGDGSLLQMGEKLAANLEVLFEGVEVRPSVLHGDLWSGNMAYVDGKPAIFDPATYYGHHEAEFGMSWCAGGCSHLVGGHCNR
jgi:protein-ribulosamine 3-kinase